VHKFWDALLKKLKGDYPIGRGNATEKTSTKINHTLSETYAGVESPLQISDGNTVEESHRLSHTQAWEPLTTRNWSGKKRSRITYEVNVMIYMSHGHNIRLGFITWRDNFINMRDDFINISSKKQPHNKFWIFIRWTSRIIKFIHIKSLTPEDAVSFRWFRIELHWRGRCSNFLIAHVCTEARTIPYISITCKASYGSPIAKFGTIPLSQQFNNIKSNE